MNNDTIIYHLDILELFLEYDIDFNFTIKNEYDNLIEK